MLHGGFRTNQCATLVDALLHFSHFSLLDYMLRRRFRTNQNAILVAALLHFSHFSVFKPEFITATFPKTLSTIALARRPGKPRTTRKITKTHALSSLTRAAAPPRISTFVSRTSLSVHDDLGSSMPTHEGVHSQILPPAFSPPMPTNCSSSPSPTATSATFMVQPARQVRFVPETKRLLHPTTHMQNCVLRCCH